jgi:tetratricopeptide (TPR) repeat protein
MGLETYYYLNMILREIPESILVPEVLYRKLVRYFTVNLDNPAPCSTYKRLYDAYPDNPYEIQARNYASRLIPAMIDYARTLSNTGYHTDALALLFEIDKYPVVDHTVIQRIISDVYQAQAEELLVAENYLGADQMFRIALQYNPDKRAEINARLSSITQLFIERGDRYLAERDFENALAHYNKTFEIIPDYEPAVRAIERLNQVRINIARAQDLVR